MKKLFLTIAVICVVFFASSCKKDSNGNSANSMTASVGGAQWSALIPAGVLSNGGTRRNRNFLNRGIDYCNR